MGRLQEFFNKKENLLSMEDEFVELYDLEDNCNAVWYGLITTIVGSILAILLLSCPRLRQLIFR